MIWRLNYPPETGKIVIVRSSPLFRRVTVESAGGCGQFFNGKSYREMKIAFFDSGIGGITVLHQAMLTLPEEDYLYYADVDHVPFGEKTREQIVSYTDEALRFMIGRGVKAVVVACNTATCSAIGYLRGKYPLPILGMEPAVKPAVEENDTGRVLVVATPVTVKGEKLQNLLSRVDGRHCVDTLALPELVTFAERGEFVSPGVRAYLAEKFRPYRLDAYSALVLGCTHFNYFKDTFRRFLPQKAEIIDGSEGTVNHLADVLRQSGGLAKNSGAVEYYASGRRVTGPAELKRIAGLHARLDRMLRY